MKRTRGFTLVEIIAVVALIALLAVVVTATIGGGLTGARVRGASKDLVAALRYTRGQAIVTRQSQALVLNLEERWYQAPGRDSVDLPKDMELHLLTAREELIDEGSGRIRFFPDGSSSGGRVTLVLGEVRWQLDVHWLTGDVDLIEPHERP
ncbi:MAG TPA: GspH/FimT family pseudopilin [Xanthomonadaceae bacterium]|nr:GspH/FimT family pseudopilin [Xanthomonadaceae bacterium]